MNNVTLCLDSTYTKLSGHKAPNHARHATPIHDGYAVLTVTLDASLAD